MATMSRPAAGVPATTLPLTGVNGAGSRDQQQRGGGGPKRGGRAATTTTMSVGEFVEARFASFERAFPGSSIPKSGGDGSGRGSSGRSGSGASTSHPPPLRREEEGDEDYDDDDDDEDDDDDAIALLDRASFLTLLTTLYLPLLLLWLRRSMFGTASLLRSLLIGHALRLLLAYAIVLPDAPPAWASDLSGRVRKTAAWRYVVGLGLFLVEAVCGPEDSAGGAGERHHRGGGGETWPPPALTALAVITVVAFVVHPDGLTWIMLGKLRDGIRYVVESTFVCLDMVRDGTIPTVVASGSLAGLFAFAGLLHRILSSRRSRGPAPHPERARQRPRKGKKGRGRHGHHGHGGGGGGAYGGGRARGRGRIRGGHYRSTKDMAGSPPPRSRSRSGSRSSTSRRRLGSDGTVGTIPELKAQSPDDGRLDVRQNEFGEPQNGRSRSGPSHESPNAQGSRPGANLPSTVVPTGSTEKVSGGPDKQAGTSAGSGGGGRRRRRGKKGPKQPSGSGPGPKHTEAESKSSSAVPPPPPPTPSEHLPPPPPPPASAVIAPPKSAQNACLPGMSQFTSPFLAAPTPPPSPLIGATPTLSLSCPSQWKGNPLRGSTGNARTVPNYPESDTATSSFFSSHTSLLLAPKPCQSSSAQRQVQQPVGSSLLLSSASVGTTPQHSSFQVAPGPTPCHLYSRSSSAPMSEVQSQQQQLQQNFYGFTSSSQPLSSALPIQQPTQKPMLPLSLAPGVGIGGTVPGLRYNVPNYASTYSYSNGDGRYTPGKIELAAFLAQVGLVGAACAGLLADLADVDALAGLTEGQFESYNIGPGKQAEIFAMLEARRQRQKEEEEGAHRQQRQYRWTPGTILRPPPGLELAPGCVGSAAVGGGAQQGQQQLPFLAPNALSCVPASSHIVPASQPGGRADSLSTNLRARCDTGESWASEDNAKANLLSFVNFGPSVGEEAEDEDSKIEADLQELGGQMVGSVLDF